MQQQGVTEAEREAVLGKFGVATARRASGRAAPARRAACTATRPPHARLAGIVCSLSHRASRRGVETPYARTPAQPRRMGDDAAPVVVFLCVAAMALLVSVALVVRCVDKLVCERARAR